MVKFYLRKIQLFNTSTLVHLLINRKNQQFLEIKWDKMIIVKGLFLFLHQSLVLDGDDCHHLFLDVIDLGIDLCDHLVHGCLVVLVEQGDGEDPHPGENDQRHHVEPRANIC